ncbi:uncharacterized protein METZ01_LOCUS431597, partial [marine metagenome]
MVLGRNSANSGKVTRIARHKPIANQKGQIPRNIVFIGTSGAMPL